MVVKENRMCLKFSLIGVVVTAFICITYVKRNPVPSHHYPKTCGVRCQVVNSTEYVIHTPGCVIPDFDPFSPSMKKYRVTKPKKFVCSKKLPLTEESGLSLIFFEERLSQYESSAKDVKCYYEGISRVKQNPKKYNDNCDKKWKLKKKIPINETETAIEEDGIVVTCDDKGKKKSIYRNVHYFIQPRRAQKKRQKFKVGHGERDEKPEKLSVIIMGTDSISRVNLRRHMPKTFEYLTNHLHAIDLKGFNKVDDNTNPNVIAMLEGLSREDIKNHTCQQGRKMSKFDDCPFIWKDFSEKGYVTAYGEDSPWMGAFHYHRAGFVKEPTDYYNRPYFQAAEKLIGHEGNGKKSNENYCQGERLSISLVHKYSLDVAERLKDIPYFGFYWSASMTHNVLSLALTADKPSFKYLKKLHEGGYLEHTILFFLSDHGLRFGNFRLTYAGLLEERLPYVTLMFPKWFKKRYPEAIHNMMTNTRRLTSTYDLHATLQDILHQTYANLTESPTVTKHGQSLFYEVPVNRTCKDAGIPEHYCACEHTKAADVNDFHLRNAATVVVEELNAGLQTFPNCTQLSLDKILSGREGSARKGTTPKERKTIVTSYLVSFVTQPGGAMMEATVKYQEGHYHLTSDVSRINMYGNQSHCITDLIYRKYCYCNDLLS